MSNLQKDNTHYRTFNISEHGLTVKVSLPVYRLSQEEVADLIEEIKAVLIKYAAPVIHTGGAKTIL